MKRIKSQKGQALILIAFGIIALIGFTALAVDGGRVFSDRRNAQNAADTSALAAALAHLREDQIGFEARGLERAYSNGYNNDADSTVTVVFCDTVKGTADECDLPTGANHAEYIRVKITSDVPMTFARVLGREFVTNRVEAITRVQGINTTGNFFGGAGLVSIRNDNANECFKVNGTANLTLHDTGIFVNCKGSQALHLNGNAKIGMDADAQVAGCTNNPGFPIGGGNIVCNVPQQTVNKDTFKDVPTTLPTPTCTSPGYKVGNTWYPGYYGSENITTTVTFMPGAFCFPGGLSVKNGGNLTGSGGRVQLVISNDIDLKGSANSFSDLEIYANNADVTIFGTLTANRLRFFGNGNSTFGVQALGVLTSGDAYIYSESGEIDIRAQSNVNLHAPPQGDTFGGLLMYMPWDNPNDFILNGGTGNVWTGTILMPKADVTYNGAQDFVLYGQVIAYSFKINGNGESHIYYDSSKTYNPPTNPTMELTK